jgi:hypothetical protein
VFWTSTIVVCGAAEAHGSATPVETVHVPTMEARRVALAAVDDDVAAEHLVRRADAAPRRDRRRERVAVRVRPRRDRGVGQVLRGRRVVAMRRRDVAG